MAEGFAYRGTIRLCYEWDWPKVEKDFLLALELNPNHVIANEDYGMFLSSQNRFEEAYYHASIARMHDPLSMLRGIDSGWMYYAGRKFDQAIIHLKTGHSMAPDHKFLLLVLIHALFENEQYEELNEKLEKIKSLKPSAVGELGFLGNLFGKLDKFDEANTILESLKSRSEEPNAPSAVALVFAGLGNAESTVKWLHIARKKRNRIFFYLNAPLWDKIRGFSGFANLMNQLGLPEATG